MQKIIGITGGTGCGKTTVLHALQDLGVHIIDCDKVYHRLLEESRPMIWAVEDAFPGVVQSGALQRKLLGQRVFSNPDALDILNKTVWPYVCRAVEEEITAFSPAACAIDAIGLFESGLHKLCTHTVAVTASTEARIARLIARDGITQDYARLRVQAQETNETYAARCDITLDNSFPTEEAFRQYANHTLKEILK